ncbi:tetratricopeptide repeat protein 19, mitochondrial isoform X1 [Trichechus manatus latirostris]|uniref:Tetratricopeptide repeat protein 19, mitochondrial isoform X1 n=1 Tax=Trichechus manatus latirostris TaxID=127582 RepID=A0A2Y9QXN0_TRIMA|nr:tetratricopeptide repeat protein 19, mitochondrial isoform X1 [Trichechus manatus latirostris]
MNELIASFYVLGWYSHSLLLSGSAYIHFLYTSLSIVFFVLSFQLSIMKDEPEEAELILHDALRLAYQSGNNKAITYTYDLMANLAFIHGQLENAEKLFKATMSYLLGGGMKQEDNAIIEISLKLASIYAAQNRQEFALAGYEFCISTLEEKMEREKELAEDIMSVEEKANTRLLLGMCLDSYARYLLFTKQPSQAQKMYEKALRISEEIQGERHPQVSQQNHVGSSLKICVPGCMHTAGPCKGTSNDPSNSDVHHWYDRGTSDLCSSPGFLICGNNILICKVGNEQDSLLTMGVGGHMAFNEQTAVLK